MMSDETRRNTVMSRGDCGEKREAGSSMRTCGASLCDLRRMGPGRSVDKIVHAAATPAQLATRSSRDGRRGHCGRNRESKLDCGPRATYGLALCVILPTTFAEAPAKGWKVKRISCRPRGQTTARKITSALRISASATR